MLFLVLMMSIPAAAQDLAQVVEMAEQGHPGAQNRLGIMYASGNGVTQDFNKAAELFEKSANQGLPGAQYNLGKLYRTGQGVPQNDVLAASWTRKAAEGGDARAQYTLGFMYANGIGLDRDPQTAALWIAKAADQGLPIAQQAINRLKAITQDMQQTESEPIPPEAMSSVVRADNPNPKNETSPDEEAEKRKAEALARIRQKRASGASPHAIPATAKTTDHTAPGTEQANRSLLTDRRTWTVLSVLLVILAVYGLLRQRR